MWAGDLGSTQRDLSYPLLSPPPPSPTKHDDVDDERRYTTPSDLEEDDEPPKIRTERMRSLRSFRRFIIGYYELWNRPCGVVMYLTYIAFAILVSIAEVDHKSHVEEFNAYNIVAIVLYWIWLFINLIEIPFIFLGRRQSLAFGGLYVNLFVSLLIALTVTAFGHSFRHEGVPVERLLLIIMAFTVYTMEQIAEPRYRELYWYYKGAISPDQIGKVSPISGIGSNALMKLAHNASKAMGISDEALQVIEAQLSGMKIRQGEEEALDDWLAVIYKLSKVVSICPPFEMFRSKSTISPAQYRNLVCQLIIYMRLYMETGRIERDDTHLTRSAPLKFGETLLVMTKLSWQVPGWFLLAIIPRSCQNALNTSVGALGTLYFMNGLFTMDKPLAVRGFVIIVSSFALSPIFALLANAAESTYSSKMIDRCRTKMFASLMKGGTEYDEKNRPGTIIDGFSSHLTQVLLFGQSFFITLIPTIMGLLAGVAFAGASYPFGIVLFISIVPIILSVDHFTRKASQAGLDKAITDAKVAGKIASAVECRKAIRASNAGDWVSTDMKDLFDQLRCQTKNSYFRSDLARNFLECGAGFFTLLVLIPLGISVIEGQIDVGTFSGITTALASMVGPLFILGQAQSNSMIFSASVKAVSDLMDSSLDEEPPSKSSEVALGSLSDSVKVRDVSFSYTASGPTVLGGVNVDIKKGTYIGIFGESGSGKTTVLNLLMRFYKPSLGSIKWDGTSIFDTTFESFREQVGVMFQQTMIYQASIRDNILFGKPEVPGEVEKAAEAAEIADVINRLPDGYDTMIGGDELAGMSGGQLQRVCMARALYRKPSVLLLDEATSALDKETSQSIIQTLLNLRDNDGLTIVSVSHHPETAMKADKIVVLKRGGVVVEEGTYDELASREGSIFHRLVNAGS